MTRTFCKNCRKRIGYSFTSVAVRGKTRGKTAFDDRETASDDRATDFDLEKALVVRKEFHETWIWDSFDEWYENQLVF